MLLWILLFIVLYSCYIALTKFPYKFAKIHAKQIHFQPKSLHKQFPRLLCKVPGFQKTERLAPWDVPAAWGLCFHFYIAPFLHSSPQALFSFPCLVSWLENTTLILIQNVSKYTSSWRKKSHSFAVTRHLGVTVSYLAMTGCMPMQSTSLTSFSPLDTEVVSDLTGLLKMSLMMLNKLKNKKISVVCLSIIIFCTLVTESKPCFESILLYSSLLLTRHQEQRGKYHHHTLKPMHTQDYIIVIHSLMARFHE